MVISFLARCSFQAKAAHHRVNDVIGMLMALGGEMEIDHGGVQAAVPQVLLNPTDVDAGFQEMSSIAVPERMNGNAFCELPPPSVMEYMSPFERMITAQASNGSPRLFTKAPIVMVSPGETVVGFTMRLRFGVGVGVGV